MKRLILAVLCILMARGAVFAGEEAPSGALEWTALPALPPAAGQTVQPGLAGAFAGVHNDAMIVAGGANFPAGWPRDAEGRITPKLYQRNIYVLEKTGAEGGYSWRLAEAKLEHGYSYGVSIPTADGLICIGGEWKGPLVVGETTGQATQERHASAAVFVLTWDAKARQVRISDRLVAPGQDMDKVHASVKLLRCANCHSSDEIGKLALLSEPEQSEVIRRMQKMPGSGISPDEVDDIKRSFQLLVGF